MQTIINVCFEVLTVVVMKSCVFWDCCLLHTGFLLGFILSPQDGSNTFL
jgi:hypothetical protein